MAVAACVLSQSFSQEGRQLVALTGWLMAWAAGTPWSNTLAEAFAQSIVPSTAETCRLLLPRPDNGHSFAFQPSSVMLGVNASRLRCNRSIHRSLRGPAFVVVQGGGARVRSSVPIMLAPLI